MKMTNLIYETYSWMIRKCLKCTHFIINMYGTVIRFHSTQLRTAWLNKLSSRNASQDWLYAHTKFRCNELKCINCFAVSSNEYLELIFLQHHRYRFTHRFTWILFKKHPIPRPPSSPHISHREGSTYQSSNVHANIITFASQSNNSFTACCGWSWYAD